MNKPRILKIIEENICLTLEPLPQVIAVITMGSCARGEETYQVNECGEKELLSDYEMIIVVENYADIDDIDNSLRCLNQKFQEQVENHGFCLEWSYKTRQELKRLDRRFIFFETKSSSRVIMGDKTVLDEMPEINCNNLNYSELDTIILHRLYHVIRDMDVPDEKYQKYLIARNTLDITSAALPHVGILVSGYCNRVAAFESVYQQLGFSRNDYERLVMYLEMKLNYSSELYNTASLENMRKWFVSDFEKLYAYQKRAQKGSPFIRSSRMFLSAVYRRNTSLLRQWYQWPFIMQTLYKDMMKILIGEENDKVLKETVACRMLSLFGY